MAKVEKGIYEVIIEKATFKKFNTGVTGLNLQLRIREDIVSNNFKKFCLFETLFLTEASKWKRDKIFVATGLKENEKDELKIVPNELPELLLGKTMKVTVDHKITTYWDKAKNKNVTIIEEHISKYEPSTVDVEKEVETEGEIDWDAEITL